MKKLILTAIILGAAAANAFAVKGVEDGSKFGTGADSIRCLESLSLYNSYYTIKDYNSAYDSWKVVFDECPQAGGRTLYSNGAFLIANKLVKESDAKKRQEWFDLLMKCYDQRVQYFGKDSRYPEVWIRGRQAIDYINYCGKPQNQVVDKVLPWLSAAVDAKGGNADADVINAYFQMLTYQYLADKAKYQESYVNSYIKTGEALDGRIAKKDKYASNYELVRGNVDQMFASSGAADCQTLSNVFGPKIDGMKDDAEKLSMVMRLFKRARCNEEEAYFKASQYAHELQPTAESASGCGYLAARNKEYAKAAQYFTEAVDLAAEDSVKYENQYMVALLQMQLGNYTQARVSAQKAAGYDGTKGEPYILIAQMYADPKHNPYPDDAILAKTVYWAAVDKLQQAKKVDPSQAATAQQMIDQYRKHFPTTEEVFFKPELQPGKEFIVGGWIGETVRARD